MDSASLDPRQIELKIHGIEREDHGRVSGRVFANKLKQLVSALEASDRVANGKLVHDYVLAAMHMSEPTAVLAEIPRDPFEDEVHSASAIPVLNDAVEGIKANDVRVKRLAPVVKHLGLLTSGVDAKFGFAEIRTANSNVIRVDSFLRKRAATARQDAKGQWFDGVVYGSFDGKLEYVDLRGALPQIKLTLSAGGKEIDCVCHREDIETLGVALDHRVRVHGRAIYTAASPLPMRVEVRKIEPISGDADLAKWVGSFSPFAMQPWDGDA